MELEKFEHTLKQVAPISDQICLHLMGEPLAHPEFEKILKICETYKAKIQITTNGLLLKKFREILLNSNCVVQINISIQSYMDNFRDGPIEEYLEKIFLFISQAMNIRPDLYMNVRLWNINSTSAHENESIFAFFEKKLNLTINRNLELGKIKSKRLVGRLYFHFDSRFEWPRLDTSVRSTNGRCNGLIDHFAIHSTGNVSPCCLDDQNIINLGNIFKDSIDSILDSPRAIAMAQGFANNRLVEELCQKCSYIERFRK